MKKIIEKDKNEVGNLISQAEAARMRGVTRGAIQDLVRRGKLQSVMIAGRALVSRREIEKFERGAAGRPKRKK